MFSLNLRNVSLAGLIAASYALLTVALAPVSFGVYQIRIAEALTVLPFVTDSAVLGLFIGCAVANYFGGNGAYDIVFGSFITLLAAVATRTIGRLFGRGRSVRVGYMLAPLPPVVFNALGVSLYLAPMTGFGYWFAVQMIGLGELAACYGLGLPLLMILARRFPGLRSER